MHTFGEHLRGFRKREGYSQQRLADNIGVSRSTIINWENSRYLPRNRDFIFKLAEELYLSPDETDELLIAGDYPSEHQTKNSIANSTPYDRIDTVRSDVVGVIKLHPVPIKVRERDILSAIQVSYRLPNTLTSEGLSKAQIKKLAKRFNLLESKKINPHLRLLDGDISYWYEQGLSLDELVRHFEARKAVLDAADRDRVIINDQGELSWAAAQLMATLLRAKAKSNR